MTTPTEKVPPSKPSVGIREFLIEYGLYRAVALGEDDDLEDELREGDIKFDAYCPGCGQSSIFHKNKLDIRSPPRSIASGTRFEPPKPSYFQVTLRCARGSHSLIFYLQCVGGKMTKVGQVPSYADLLVGELGDGAKVLSPADRRELVKAYRLFSSDAAVGGFVYLRRVFENLIERVRSEAEANGTTFEGWRDQRMGERIDTLAAHLPPAVVANAAVWTILSAGVHALSEDDCKRYFPALRAALVQILHQEAAQRQRKIDEEEPTKAIKSILGEINQAATAATTPEPK